MNYNDVNHLVLNMYPDGYSIAVKLNQFPIFTSETILETAKISYEETRLLDYIENEELPPLLVDMIDSSPKLSQYKIWHNGCLILEVRDKISQPSNDSNNLNSKLKLEHSPNFRSNRNFYNSPEDDLISDIGYEYHIDPSEIMSTDAYMMCDDEQKEEPKHEQEDESSHFILLKPTNLSIMNDVSNLTDTETWSAKDRLELESQLVLYNSPPLALETEPREKSTEVLKCKGNDTDNHNTGAIHTRKSRRIELPYVKLKQSGHVHSVDCRTTADGNNFWKTPTKSFVKPMFNGVYDDSATSEMDDGTHVELPAEFSLQQFLAERREKRKSSSLNHIARFQRFSRSLSRNSLN